MNQIMKEYYPTFEMYQALRGQLMEMLVDEDLAFQPSGNNPPLGTLCREIGEIEVSYTDSFKHWQQDFSYRYPNPAEIETSVARLTAWFTELDADMKQTIAGLSDEDLATKMIDRGPEFKMPPRLNLTIYTEALLIFYGKVSVYLKIMGKELPQQWQEWIG
jgi:hypothetical protein